MSNQTPTTGSEDTNSATSLLDDVIGGMYDSDDEVEKKEDVSAPEDAQPEEVDEVEDADQGEPDEDDQEEGAQEDSDQEEDVEELREYLANHLKDPDKAPEWLKGLKVNTKINGEAVSATFADLVKNYQIGEAAERRLSEAKAKSTQIIEDANRQREAFNEKIITANKILESAEQMIEADAKAIDWQKLREDDPAEYAAKKSEIEERRQRIQSAKSGVVDQYKAAVNDQMAQMQRARQEALAREHQALLEKIPEWQDADKAKAEKTELAQYLMQSGFNEQEIAAAADHRLIIMARKAMMHDKSKTKVDLVKKKVAKVPKTIKTSSAKPSAKEENLEDYEILYGS